MEKPEEQKPVETPEASPKPAETPAEKKPGDKPEEKPVEGEGEGTKPEEQESSVIKLLRRQNRALSKGLNSMRREVEELRGMAQPPVQPAPDGSEEQPAEQPAQPPQRVPQRPPQNGPNPVQAKIAEAEKAHTDFQEHWAEAQTINLPDAVGKTLMHTISLQTYGSDVLYEVVKDPVILDEFAAMHPAEVAARLGEMHAEIRRVKTEPKPKPIPKAPPPITPVGGGGAAGDPDPEKMSDDEYFAYRRKQVARK